MGGFFLFVCVMSFSLSVWVFLNMCVNFVGGWLSLDELRFMLIR